MLFKLKVKGEERKAEVISKKEGVSCKSPRVSDKGLLVW